MSGKNNKLLRKGAKKYKLPLNKIKNAFNSLNKYQKAEFLKVAKIDNHE